MIKCLYLAFSPFPNMTSLRWKTNTFISIIHHLSFAIIIDKPKILSCGKSQQCRMIEWCFMLLTTVFRSYTAAHIFHAFPRFHQYLAGAMKCSAQEHSHKKPLRSRVARTQGSWITIQTFYHRATKNL